MNFSVVTPAYNSLQHLRRCIGSVRGQAGVEVEHLVMDGGSSDGTADWLKRWRAAGAHDAPDSGAPSAYTFRWTSAPDHGMYDAIDRGWQRARGDVLSWLNCDEQYLPGTLARVAQIFDGDPGVDAIFGDTIVVAPDGSPLAARREIPLRRSYLKNSFLYASSCATFFRRSLWTDGLLRLDSRYRYAADMELMLQLLAAKKRIRHIPYTLSLFGVDGGNLSSTQFDAMAVEVRAIQKTHRAMPSLLRIPYRALRCIERLFRGCYRPVFLSYDFALDETPRYRHIQPTRTGFRFTYARAARQLAARRRTGPDRSGSGRPASADAPAQTTPGSVP